MKKNLELDTLSPDPNLTPISKPIPDPQPDTKLNLGPETRLGPVLNPNLDPLHETRYQSQYLNLSLITYLNRTSNLDKFQKSYFVIKFDLFIIFNVS